MAISDKITNRLNDKLFCCFNDGLLTDVENAITGFASPGRFYLETCVHSDSPDLVSIGEDLLSFNDGQSVASEVKQQHEAHDLRGLIENTIKPAASTSQHGGGSFLVALKS